jgi:hypothetical protein
MPAYVFEIRWNGGEKTSWTYLPTDDSARHFARLLVQNFKGSDQYHAPANMTVKNDTGALIDSVQF